jgi:hypothetical protein
VLGEFEIDRAPVDVAETPSSELELELELMD